MFFIDPGVTACAIASIGFGISCSQELGDVVDPVSKTRVILLAASVAVAGTSLWCAGPQQGRVRLEARKSAGQYKRPGWRPLTQA